MLKRLTSLCCLTLMAAGTIAAAAPHSDSFESQYKLQEMVVLSRHNIRSP